MTNVLSEKDYQKYLLERLAANGYVIRKSTNFDRLFAVDREMLMKFLTDTQPDTICGKSTKTIWRIPSSASSTQRLPKPEAA